MTRDQLKKVIRLASYEVDAMIADGEGGAPAAHEALAAVKAFCDNERSTWMQPAERGVDAVKEKPVFTWPGNRN